MKYILSILLICLVACSTGKIKYKNDSGFVTSTVANVSEFHATINDGVCIDMDGKVGGCYKRIYTNKDVIIKLMKQPYMYKFILTCSSKLDFTLTKYIQKDMELSVVIPHEKYGELKSFTCRGTAYPEDRDEAVSMRFTVRVELVVGSYAPRETIYTYIKDKKVYLVLGAYALYSKVFDNEVWKYYKKKTVVEISSSKVIAMSQSFAGRCNYYGF